MANEPVKRYSMPLVIREVQIKATTRYHFTLKSKRQTIISVDKDVENLETSYIADGLVKQCSQCSGSSKC